MKKEEFVTRHSKVVEAIQGCIILSHDPKKFDVSVLTRVNQKDPSMATVNASIQLKGSNASRQLTISVDVDKRTGMIHVVILNISGLNSNILFTTSEENPIGKIEKYLPNIISSTEKILMSKYNVPERRRNG